MKVQTKITLLLLAVVATFMAGLWAFRIYDRQKFARIAEDRQRERKESFEAFLQKDGEPLKTLADYDAYWDDVIPAIAKRKPSGFIIPARSSFIQKIISARHPRISRSRRKLSAGFSPTNHSPISL
jgi:hypothetical protein